LSVSLNTPRLHFLLFLPHFLLFHFLLFLLPLLYSSSSPRE